VGSYAAALLAAFDDDASRAAHTAAWRAKQQQLMQHNADVARRMLAETVALKAAAEAARTTA
jgi:hypothetical protein